MVKIEVSIKFYIDVLEICNFIMSFVTFHPFHWMTDKQIGVLIVTESPLVGYPPPPEYGCMVASMFKYSTAIDIC